MTKMKLFSKDYFELFVKREGRVMLGQRNANLWLLTLVLVATFLAISFSSGSLRYLRYKMNDPFINWVDIKNDYGGGDLDRMAADLNDHELMDRFHYRGYQADHDFAWFFFGKEDDQTQYLKIRFFGDIRSSLVESILSKENVAHGCRVADLSEVDQNTVGVIMTEDAMRRLGYESPYPAFVDYCRYSPGAAELGFVEIDNNVRIPLPLLGVVHRLPGGFDVISTKYCYFQDMNDFDYPFLVADHPEYAKSLFYFVPDEIGVDAFMSNAQELADEQDLDASVDDQWFYRVEMVPYKPGSFISITFSEEDVNPMDVKALHDGMMAAFPAADVHRVFNYDFSDYEITKPAYLSVHFRDLDKIGDFQEYVKKVYKVDIEMSQIEAKKNFNAVSIMANILSWAIIFFAITCIILFIVNLLQSYFQKVKRNLGTFKAFGVSNRRLISVYVLIVGAIVLSSVLIALLISFFAQEFLILIHFLKDGTYSYLSLWSVKTMVSILIIIVASVSTVFVVMRRLLRQTPGDLIYDRQ